MNAECSLCARMAKRSIKVVVVLGLVSTKCVNYVFNSAVMLCVERILQTKPKKAGMVKACQCLDKEANHLSSVLPTLPIFLTLHAIP